MSCSGSDSLEKKSNRGISASKLLIILGSSAAFAAVAAGIDSYLFKPKPSSYYFQQTDINKDGIISPSEWDSFYKSNNIEQYLR